MTTHDADDDVLRRTVVTVLLANLGYFFVEYSVAIAIGSVALFADSIDFLEDAAVNLRVLLAMGWSAVKRRAVGLVLAALLLVPGFAALWTAYEKILDPQIADPLALSVTGMGAFAVNLFCAWILARTGRRGGTLVRAAFLSARNDVLANVAIVVAGVVTYLLTSIWPDIIVGLAIAALNASSAYEVYEASLEEGSPPKP